MSRVSEKVITVLSQEYEEDHPIVMTVSFGIPVAQCLMISMLFYSLVFRGIRFFKRKKAPNSQN